ncbi:MAG: cobalamin synthase [Bryobacterales bacterium]|jgi:adenosylcobinamide-GDP ribazoletransferase|nr:cobalamin synthase [Bryobacterales bacterium]
MGFRAAIRFLTILPVRGGDASPGRAAAFFPLVGAMLGAAGAGVYFLAAKAFPVSLAALATVAFWITISGVLHEDGLADVADAVRAGRTRERVLSILKDSRIGTFGAVAILLSVLARWQALEFLATPRFVETMIAAQAVPRAAIVAMAWCSRPAGSGLGSALASTLSTPAAVAAMAQGAAAALICGWRPGLAMIAGSVLIVQAARAWFYRRLGGVNGDCLGFTEQMLEIFVLLMFACRSCAW